MIGTIRLNFIVGAAAFLITFMISVTHNIWLTTLLRSLYSFIVLFVITFACRWILGTFAGLKDVPAALGTVPENEALKGSSIDAITPDDEDADLHRMLGRGIESGGSDGDTGFAPLNPRKLSTKVEAEPEELARAVRRMTEE
ncbi:hypothetical protein LJK88_22375 [Paenibacillus sp. P26]|nr:hypothetical protein LJK88_22375 [Paenibacillus sp. P26]UUZ95703.1 hypothetical protein LJK87_15500 [Paenibacillus sp. P25]